MGLGCSFPVGAGQPLAGGLEAGRRALERYSPAPAGRIYWSQFLWRCQLATGCGWVKGSVVTFLPLSRAQPAALHLCGESLHGAG